MDKKIRGLKLNKGGYRNLSKFFIKRRLINLAYKEAYNVTTGYISLSINGCEALMHRNMYSVIMFYNSETKHGILAKQYSDHYINYYDGLTLYLVDISKENKDCYMDFFNRYHITALPYFCLVKDGVIEKYITYLSDDTKLNNITYMEQETEQLKEWLKEYLFVY